MTGSLNHEMQVSTFFRGPSRSPSAPSQLPVRSLPGFPYSNANLTRRLVDKSDEKRVRRYILEKRMGIDTVPIDFIPMSFIGSIDE